MKIVLRLTGLLFVLAGLAFPGQALAQGSGPQDRTEFGGSYTLRTGEALRNLTVLGGEVVLEAGSTIEQQVFLYGGHLTINGSVQGDVHTYGGTLILGSAAVVSGDVAVVGGTLERVDGARVDGQLSNSALTPFNFRLPSVPGNSAEGVFASMLWLGMQTVGLTLLAMLVVLLAPKVTERAGAAAVGRPWEAGGLGLLIAIVTPPLLIGLAITVIGIPVTLVLAVLAIIVLTFGWIALGLEVGKRLAHAFSTDWPLVVDAVLGTLVLSLVANGIGLTPCVGWIVPVAVGFIGMGGVILSGFGTHAYPAPSVLAQR